MNVNKSTGEVKSEIFELINSIQVKILNSNTFKSNIVNSMIESFLVISEKLKGIDVELFCENQLADEFVSIVSFYKEEYHQKDLLNAKFVKLVKIFNEYIQEIIEKIKYNIYIYGVNEHSVKLTDFLNNKVQILGFISEGFEESLNYNINILSENELKINDFDYVIIVSQQSNRIIKRIRNSVPATKIINFNLSIKNFLSKYEELYSENYYLSKLFTSIKKIERNEDIKVIISGLSYSLRGVVEDNLKEKSIKICLPSQDLYYDYQIAKRVLKKESSIKYCIIGISHYSFDWDLSLTSSESSRILNVYYPLLNDSHHLRIPDSFERPIGIESINMLVDKRLLNLGIKGIYPKFIEKILNVNLTPEYLDKLWNSSTYLSDSIISINEKDSYHLGKIRANAHNRLNYPKTHQENKNILIKYLRLLSVNNVKPIVVVFPTTKYYYENLDPTITKKFYKTINEILSICNFQFIDLFSSAFFEKKDFADWDHLNKEGAIKMTNLLNEMIEW